MQLKIHNKLIENNKINLFTDSRGIGYYYYYWLKEFGPGNLKTPRSKHGKQKL